MIKENQLTESEKAILQEAQKNSMKAHFRNRCLAILLLDSGKSVSYVSDLLNIRQEAIYKWSSRWASNGLAGLRILPGRGVKAKLDSLTAPAMRESLDLIKKK